MVGAGDNWRVVSQLLKELGKPQTASRRNHLLEALRKHKWSLWRESHEAVLLLLDHYQRQQADAGVKARLAEVRRFYEKNYQRLDLGGTPTEDAMREWLARQGAKSELKIVVEDWDEKNEDWKEMDDHQPVDQTKTEPLKTDPIKEDKEDEAQLRPEVLKQGGVAAELERLVPDGWFAWVEKLNARRAALRERLAAILADPKATPQDRAAAADILTIVGGTPEAKVLFAHIALKLKATAGSTSPETRETYPCAAALKRLGWGIFPAVLEYLEELREPWELGQVAEVLSETIGAELALDLLATHSAGWGECDKRANYEFLQTMLARRMKKGEDGEKK